MSDGTNWQFKILDLEIEGNFVIADAAIDINVKCDTDGGCAPANVLADEVGIAHYSKELDLIEGR